MLLPDYIHTIDTHTAGGPTRIVTSGLPFLKGRTVKEKMEYFKNHLDHYTRARKSRQKAGPGQYR